MPAQETPKRLICIFDSGIGGLNLLYSCAKYSPNLDFAYFADNYNVPYGNMSADELYARTFNIFKEIEKLNPAAAVVACNTVTALCIEGLRAEFPFRILGIQPAVKPAAAEGECIVLATSATANSPSLKNLIAKHGRGRTSCIACPQLAGYIEENIFSLSKEKILSMLPDVCAGEVALGCTHYSFVAPVIKSRYNCRIWDGAEGVAANLCKILGFFDHQRNTPQKIEFLSGNARKNAEIYEKLLKFGQDYFCRNCLP